MGVQQVAKHERLFLANGAGPVEPAAGPHPAVLAHVPFGRMAWVGRMVEVGDAFDRAAGGRAVAGHGAAVIHPRRRASEDGRLALVTLAVADLPAAKVDRK